MLKVLQVTETDRLAWSGALELDATKDSTLQQHRHLHDNVLMGDNISKQLCVPCRLGDVPCRLRHTLGL